MGRPANSRWTLHTAQGGLTALVALVWLTAGCASIGGGGGPLSSAGSAREEQVLVTRFADIYGVAVSQRSVFLLTNGALGIYDRIFHRWMLPVGFGDDATRALSIIAADPVTDAVWIGGAGLVARYEPALELWTRAVVPGTVDQIVFDRRDPASGALVHAGGGWSRVSPSGAVMPLFTTPNEILTPITLDELHREFPALRTTEALLTRDASLHSWPVISGSRGLNRLSEVWLGTFGGGAFEVDPNFNQSRPQTFGLADAGVGALARGVGGVWIAPWTGTAIPLGMLRGSPSRGSLTFASDDLQHWRWVDPDPASALGGGRLAAVDTYDLIVSGETLWIASDRGLLRMETAAQGASRPVGTLGEIGADRINALALWHGGLVAATSRGAALVDTARLTVTPLTSASTRALVAAGDTLWLGGDAGLYSIAGGPEGALRQLATRAIRALAHSDTLVIAASEGELFRVAGTSVIPLLPAINLRVVGGIESLDADARSIVAGGPMGIVVVGRSTGATRTLRTVTAVRDVLLSTVYLWVATDAGLLRVQRVGETIP